MSLTYLSVFSGIEAASVAWKPLGFEAIGFSEIDPFASEVLKQRFPTTKNYGDITKHTTWGIEPGTTDILVGGSPCQAFSVAGLRQGMQDPRGNLALTFLAIADRLKPKWIVWENVPGVLSSSKGQDFSSFITAMGEIGYGYAWRVLNAEHFGVPQRRKRIFLVGSIGNPTAAAEVLCIREGLLGYLNKSKEKQKTTATNVGTSIESNNQFVTQSKIAGTLDSHYYKGPGSRQGGEREYLADNLKIRRLTPKECERLQGFPDNWTQISWKGKAVEDCPDGPRYKACGNSMAVPVMRWIGERIKEIDSNLTKQNG